MREKWSSQKLQIKLFQQPNVQMILNSYQDCPLTQLLFYHLKQCFDS